eukprot:7145476-Prymnesium_polylepis.1
MDLSWSAAHRTLQNVLHGAAQPELLHQLLDALVESALVALPWQARSQLELTQVLDPNFEHCGHTLEPAGRTLVVQLAEELALSELVCWEMLLREVSRGAPGLDLDLSELKDRLACTYKRERHSMLLVLTDCLKLCADASYSANPAWPVAAAFLSRLERGGAAADAAGAVGPFEGIAQRVLQTIDMLLKAGGGQSASQELGLCCECLFWLSAGGLS